MAKKFFTVDGNYAVSHVAYMFSDVAAIYPITPSSSMAENCDEMAAKGRKNLFNQKVNIVEMQSEGGAAGAVHGSLQAGALTTTFTASQGLLLMIPNMYKIAGELLPAVFHVSARSVACSALSIFGDHSDVMAARQTGFAMLASASVQQAQDMAAISHIATLETRVPFLHFFEGFRVSHEIQKIEMLTEEDMANFLEPTLPRIKEFRDSSMNPNRPDTRGTAQNPDIFFQAREGTNPYYVDCADKVQNVMDRFAKLTGRSYRLYDYHGAPDADKVIVVMGSAAQTVSQTVEKLNSQGEKVGVLVVRLYRPFSAKHFLNVLPKSVKKIAVLDRTKEPGSLGEPLYQDIQTVLDQARKGIVDSNFAVDPMVVGGRYGLSSKEFTPEHVVSIFNNLDEKKPKHSFTVGIEDDVTHLSLPKTDTIDVLPEGTISCKFWGLGSDGTVGANKNSIKIIGDNTNNFAQGYFVYDSKKSGGITVSHLRFGKDQIKAPYLITNADFIALHNQAYLGRYDVLEGIKEGGNFLLNSQWSGQEAWDNLPYDVQKTIIDKKVKFYNVNAYKVAQETGLGHRINVVMQAAFFIISGVLPKDEAINYIKEANEKSYGRKGQAIVDKNNTAVDKTEASIEEITIPSSPTAKNEQYKLHADSVGGFVSDVCAVVMRNKGDDLPVSKIPCNGAFQAGITQYEKRGIATEIPVWLHDKCIQCNICSFVCPHGVIRAKQATPEELKDAPGSFLSKKSTTKNDRDLQFVLQVSPMDCTGCGSCVVSCPAKEKALELKPFSDVLEVEQERFAFFDKLPTDVVEGADPKTLKGSQFVRPLFEYSGACAGCGETPYVKLVTQIAGDRLYVANATGCSSIYGGTAPFSPYCTTEEGRGPTWANSLFEDNAEFGFGMELGVSQIREKLFMDIGRAVETNISGEFKTALNELVNLKDSPFESLNAARKVEQLLPGELKSAKGDAKAAVEAINDRKDYLGKKSFWIFGGDGWAYDIGYGGLDHVLAQGRDVNVLVMDTEVYSNTGGQSSKATPIGATAKFAAAGKRIAKKDLGLMAMSYGYVYVASVSMGANRNQTMKAFIEAESYPGPSIIIAYSPCVAHGINMRYSQDQQKKAVESGYWPLYRYNPQLAEQGKNPLVWESPAPKIDYIKDFVETEGRFTALRNIAPDEADAVFEQAKKEVERRRRYLEKLASLD
jgi:pyruvate-ferredoxin/flavodoxin oxidoreductase